MYRNLQDPNNINGTTKWGSKSCSYWGGRCYRDSVWRGTQAIHLASSEKLPISRKTINRVLWKNLGSKLWNSRIFQSARHSCADHSFWQHLMITSWLCLSMAMDISQRQTQRKSNKTLFQCNLFGVAGLNSFRIISLLYRAVIKR